jgi:hypothetical protein
VGIDEAVESSGVSGVPPETDPKRGKVSKSKRSLHMVFPSVEEVATSTTK